MAEFIRKPLQLLDNIYRFVGGLKGTPFVNLNSDIQLVHDVSRQAEKAGLGGYYGFAQWQDDLNVNGNLEEELLRTTEVLPLLDQADSEADYELWILGGSVWVSNTDLADFTDVAFYFGTTTSTKYARQFGTAGSQYHLLHFSDALYEMANTGGTEIHGTAFVPPQPVRTLPNGFLAHHGSSTAACLMHFTWDLWIGPAGASPPGRG